MTQTSPFPPIKHLKGMPAIFLVTHQMRSRKHVELSARPVFDDLPLVNAPLFASTNDLLDRPPGAMKIDGLSR